LEKSAVINVEYRLRKKLARPITYVTSVLWKKSGEPWANEELVPVKSIKVEPAYIDVVFSDETKRVSFE
jgi:hypothetical protein